MPEPTQEQILSACPHNPAMCLSIPCPWHQGQCTVAFCHSDVPLNAYSCPSYYIPMPKFDIASQINAGGDV